MNIVDKNALFSHCAETVKDALHWLMEGPRWKKESDVNLLGEHLSEDIMQTGAKAVLKFFATNELSL